MLKATRIRIRNLLGFEELELRPGDVTIIEGRNASGKTSVLEVVKGMLSGGHDATLLRVGAERGEAVLELSDGVEIRKVVTADKTDLKVRHPEVGPVSRAATYVKELVDLLSVNPVEFLTAKDRAKELLASIPAKTDVAALEAILEGAVDTGEVGFAPSLEELFADSHPLVSIELIRKTVFDARTGVNRIEKEKTTSAKELRESVPDGGTESPEELDEEIQAETAVVDGLVAEVEESEHSHAERAEAEKEKVRRWATKRVAELQEDIRRVEREGLEGLREIEEKYRELSHDTTRESVEAIEEGRAAIAVLRERRTHATGHSRVRTMAERAEQEAGDARTKARALTEVLETLDGYRRRLADELMPIEGGEVRDGELYVGGVPFPRLNTERQIRIAVEVAKRRAGKLGLVVVDNLEHLDSERFAIFVEEIRAAGLQAIVTRVTDGDFAVHGAETGTEREA